MKTLASARQVAEIRGRIEALTEGDVRRWGLMSVGEMVCHVRESYRLALGERGAGTVKMALPARAIKWVALRSPTPWPHGVETVPELRVGGAGLTPGSFAEDTAAALEQMERFVEARENRTAHPIFGAMRPEDWMRWGYLHADHHLRQFGR